MFKALYPTIAIQLAGVNLKPLGKVSKAVLVSEAFNCCFRLCLARICTDKNISFFKTCPLEPKQVDHVAHTSTPWRNIIYLCLLIHSCAHFLIRLYSPPGSPLLQPA